MDKNAIKKYAVWARRELISRVSQKALQYGISDKDIVPANATSVNGVVLSAEELKQRKALIEQINSKGYEQVMEEVAYTWFNRFCALRFMEVNGYLPSHVRVFTDEDNNFKPQILGEAINLEMAGLDMEKVYALKDANDDDSLFEYLVIVQCNALSPILPGMFQRISDYTELLFPDNLLRDGSAIQQMIELIPEEDWQDAVQIIGWLYQFYNIEPKADVFAKSGKISKEEIPAATQLFTPDWIVRYMVENSLGRLWVEGHPNDELKSKWKYYLEEAEQEPEVQSQLTAIRKEYATITPEQIKCIDPCSGSGHICAYMFDVLVQIYEAYGYTACEAVRSIVENNIYGLDIDERAAQLAYFAVMMKARQYDRRFLTRKDEDGNPDVPQPHVYAIVESNGIDSYALDYFVNGDAKLKAAMDSIMREMRDAKEYGSILNITPVDFATLYARFDEVRDDISISREAVLNDILPLVEVAEILVRKYDAVITNPPYLAVSAAGSKLNDYVKKYFPDSKTDLFAVFIERCAQMTKSNGLLSMITMHSWMFISSYERLRNKYLLADIVSMAHLGARAFEEIAGEVVQTTSFVQRKTNIANYISTFCRLVAAPSQQQKEDIYLRRENMYHASKTQFSAIPGNPLAYWASRNISVAFQTGVPVSDLAVARNGMKTGDNNRFLRLWWEVCSGDICLTAKNCTDAIVSRRKWFPYNKGGEARKWYGNNEYIVNWENEGNEIFNHAKADGRNVQDYPSNMKFTPSGTWSLISTGKPTFRYKECNLSDIAGMSFYLAGAKTKSLLGFCNSSVACEMLQLIAPTINYQAGDVGRLPILNYEKYNDRIALLVDSCITHSREEWDSFETSWDFRTHPLAALRITGAFAWSDNAPTVRLAAAYAAWEQLCQGRFEQLKTNEEELNRIFIDIYGLQDELTPEVTDNDVTVRLADKKRDIKSLISYAVGCMFGRYSLDVEGIAFAGGEWDDSKYVTFKADKDSIIPICDDEYFSDDIVGRFVRFIEVVYGKETLNENLRFIADALGGSGQPKEVIRNYFLNDFYADHLKIYQKRPIYWLFDSGKKNGFKALVYMHRYAPDTIARMRTDYVHEQQSRYRTAIADLEQRIASASTSERVKLNKKYKTLQEQSAEIQGYEEKIHHLADQYISIDLDDGVKKNYAIFGDVLAKIK